MNIHMITPEQQVAFVEELPEVFIPVKGGWGRSGATHVRLDLANEDLLTGALRTAWKLRLEKNAKADQKRPSAVKTSAHEEPITQKALVPFDLTLLPPPKRCTPHARTCKQCPESSPSLHTPRCNISPTSPCTNKPDARTSCPLLLP